MAVLKKDEFFAAIKARIGDDSSDETIKFLEDMTDTYNDLNNKAGDSGEDWKAKYEQNDKEWRERYKNRFYSTGTETDPIPDPEPEEKKTEEEEKAENIQIDDLFTKADSKE